VKKTEYDSDYWIEAIIIRGAMHLTSASYLVFRL